MALTLLSLPYALDARGLMCRGLRSPCITVAARALGVLLRLGPDVAPDEAAARFGDYRGYLYFCCLGSNLLARGLIHAAPLSLPRSDA